MLFWNKLLPQSVLSFGPCCFQGLAFCQNKHTCVLTSSVIATKCQQLTILSLNCCIVRCASSLLDSNFLQKQRQNIGVLWNLSLIVIYLKWSVLISNWNVCIHCITLGRCWLLNCYNRYDFIRLHLCFCFLLNRKDVCLVYPLPLLTLLYNIVNYPLERCAWHHCVTSKHNAVNIKQWITSINFQDWSPSPADSDSHGEDVTD